jgi:midasin
VSPFKTSPLATLDSADVARTHALLVAYYRLLTADPRLATRLDWPTAPLHALRAHADVGVRLLAIHVLAKIRGWSEARRAEMEAVSGLSTAVDCSIMLGYTITEGQLVPSTGDAWILPVLEDRRVRAYAPDEAVESETAESVVQSDLCRRTAVIGRRLFLAHPTTAPAVPLTHVPTAAMNTAIEDISPLLQRGSPVLITAPPSAGKTHIVQWLSSQLYPSSQPTNRILTIPLADTTIDVKSLIGTYVSSPTKPGTFEWMEGALAKAVRSGRWVVFEDIDKASLEMLVTISGITKSLTLGRVGRRATLPVPGRDEIEAGDGFAIFATRTIRADALTPPIFFGHQDFAEVSLLPPSDDDILAILEAQFTRLPRSVAATLVAVWRDLRPLSKTSGQVKARDIGLRDLEKWCARVQRALPPPASLAALEESGSGAFGNAVFQDETFLEAADIFIASLDNRAGSPEKCAKMVSVMAEGLGMDVERATSLVASRRPRLEAEKGNPHIHVGRYTLDAATGKRRKSDDDRPYALTRPSLVALERIAAAVSLSEPALLVGETGTGKTTSVQHLATLVGKQLTALNLSTQTETSDLVGGFKPIDAAAAARTIHTRWQKLFTETFSVGKAQNGQYLEAAAKALSARKWGRCADLWATSARRAVDKLNKTKEAAPEAATDPADPRKRRKVVNKAARAAVLWQALLVDIADFDLHHVKMKSKLVFSFVEGPLVKALKNGEWILLDEVNLATQETLEAIATILEASTASLVLTERGDVEPIPRHPDFRLFACMNPATDVGKKDLPAGLRARFTELYVPPPDDDREALIAIVEGYLGDAAAGDRGVVLDVVELYSTLKRLSAAKEIVDGSNAAPHYSMRTLARALMFAVKSAPIFGLRRGLWEGALMAFTMSLDAESARKAHEVCEKHILGPMKNARAVLAQVPTLPPQLDADDFVRFGPFWLRRGPLPPAGESRYIITPSVQAKLSDLARVILTKRYPVLIQGPTSAGKTSAVEFLAQQTGHRFVRINNHEHTDIQEYLGTYVTDPQTGNLVFQEGLLVTAVRQGHWIVLDELNLAPTDVLEALNRLLDDNRELVIPETQEVIKPHPNFILFATQNPPGLYAGRKVLSRAFRNRFLEVHFDDVPKDELETILCQRCAIAPTYAKKIVQVFEELRHRRQASRVFESKSSFATLRDLFRWAERKAVGYQQLAEDGYMLLAERARSDDDKVVIQEVIEKIMKVKINVNDMYQLFDGDGGIFARLPFKSVESGGLVWTKAMQRLFSLVATAAAHDEPVLLVGETGCGKTSVCEVLAQAFSQKLVGINCHQNMETADLLGSQRPVRNRHERRAKVFARMSELGIPYDAVSTDDQLLVTCTEVSKMAESEDLRAGARDCVREIKRLSALFEWVDGPLIHAMHDGDLLLLDEVSLADDSVLERLNSVLEPGRTLVLAEKGGVDIDEATIIANSRFHVVATMNPGGDFGKKELSPALRNRFTEIWVPALGNRDDLLQIIGQSWRHAELAPAGPLVLDFLNWFGDRVGDSSGLGLRDILAWVNFSNQMFVKGTLGVPTSFHHGGQMVIVDGLESLPQVAGTSTANVAALRQECMDKLTEMAATLGGDVCATSDTTLTVSPDSVAISGFAVPRGPLATADTAFRFNAPTTALNAMRVLRGCQLPKAILLEGSPGVGKTSLVSALAATAGYTLQRINLSDQTDLIDLFGSDLPVEGGAAGEFQWRDAAFLDAMQKGDWVLLDEMNLASQTVLEGLNAVLDHRGTVYIPELGRSFDRHPSFRVFAAQNPLTQGGGRKGLPKSFLNRFTKVYLQEHTPEDLLLICRGLHPAPEDIVQRMIAFNESIRKATMVTRTIGREGSPWEFNLRDLFRWFGLLAKKNGLEVSDHPVEHLATVYLQRFRNAADRAAVSDIFESVFGVAPQTTRPAALVTPSFLQIGHSAVPRAASAAVEIPLPTYHLPLAESVLKAVEMGWLVILAGDAGRGKRDLVRDIATAAGRPLGEFAMHPGVDTSEILGTFEQQDAFRVLDAALHAVRAVLEAAAEVNPPLSVRAAELATAREKCNDARALDATAAFIATSQSILADVTAVGIDTTTAAKAVHDVERAGPSVSGFAWVDGQLLDAIRTGGWFLVSDANLCSASVLDRLNSLCEIDGVLVMSEKGSATGAPEVITPHPDFRLFMTYDPRHGELSRAMRNRGVELFVDAPTAPAPVVPKSYALAENTVLRSVEGASVDSASADAESLQAAPLTATIAASQSRVGIEILTRLAATGDEGLAAATAFLADPRVAALLAQHTALITERGVDSTLAAELPFDASLDANTPVGDFGVVRALQLVLRNAALGVATDAWILDPANTKSVLATSALAARRGTSRRKPTAGDGVFPLISLLRTVLPSLALDALAAHGDVAAAETVLMLLSLVEEHTRSEAFDYSSIQLLAAWLGEQLAKLPAATKPREATKALAKITTLTSGLGQAPVWTLFRAGVLSPEQRTQLGQLATRLGDVADGKLRLDAVYALVAAAKAGVPEEAVTELSALIDSLPRRNAESTAADTPWANAGVAHVIELDLLTGSRDERTLALLSSSADASPADILSVLAPGDGTGATLASVAAWLRRLWRTSPGALFTPVGLASALRFSRASNVPMAQIAAMDEALKFTTDATLWAAARADDRTEKAAKLVFGLLSLVSVSCDINKLTTRFLVLSVLLSCSPMACPRSSPRRATMPRRSRTLSRASSLASLPRSLMLTVSLL